MRTLGTVSIMILSLLQRCRGGGGISRRSPSLRLLPSSSSDHPPRRRRRLPLPPRTSSSSSSSPLAAFAFFGGGVDPGIRRHLVGFRSTSMTTGRSRFLVSSSSPTSDGPPASSPSSSFVDDGSKSRRRMAKKDDDDVLSVRGLYKFRPLRVGSSRPMPPTSFAFDGDGDCGEEGENEGEENSVADHLVVAEDDASNRDDVVVAESAAARVVGTTTGARRSRMKTMIPNETSSSSSSGVAVATTTTTTTGIDATEEEDYPSGDASSLSDDQTPPLSPPPLNSRRATTATTPTIAIVMPPQSSADVSSTYANNNGRFASRVTPSFMEPEKVRAMTASSIAVVVAEDPENRVLPPAEASKSGNSVTTNLDALSRQLEHLASQIYRLNDGIEFNVNSPRQVARVLFGDDMVDNSSTEKDALEAMASAGNEMAACIYKYRKLSREVKREARRIEQSERGDRKNDYYGNLARHDDRKRRGGGSVTGENEAVSENCVDGNGMNGDNNAGSDKSATSSSTRAISDGNAAAWEPHRREPLLLIDASAYIYRAYHAIPPLHRTDGTPTGALHGVCRMLQNLLLPRLLKGERPRVVLAFDFKGKNFRHDAYPEYKANRGPCPEDLVPQFALIREASEAFGVVRVDAEGYEADDVIATLTRRALEEGVDVDILSGDKDLMQLITPAGIIPSVHMIDPMHFDRVDHDDVVKKWGVGAEQLGDVLALAGDSSDNIPGVPGIGPKIAAGLINEFGTLSNLIRQADTIKQKKRRESLMENAEKVLLFRKLVTLDESIPVSKMTLPSPFQDVSAFRMSTFDPNRLIDFYKRMELNSCQNQLESRLRSSRVIDEKHGGTRPAAASPSINFKSPPSPEEYEGVPF